MASRYSSDYVLDSSVVLDCQGDVSASEVKESESLCEVVTAADFPHVTAGGDVSEVVSVARAPVSSVVGGSSQIGSGFNNGVMSMSLGIQLALLWREDGHYFVIRGLPALLSHSVVSYVDWQPPAPMLLVNGSDIVVAFQVRFCFGTATRRRRQQVRML